MSWNVLPKVGLLCDNTVMLRVKKKKKLPVKEDRFCFQPHHKSTSHASCMRDLTFLSTKVTAGSNSAVCQCMYITPMQKGMGTDTEDEVAFSQTSDVITKGIPSPWLRHNTPS